MSFNNFQNQTFTPYTGGNSFAPLAPNRRPVGFAKKSFKPKTGVSRKTGREYSNWQLTIRDGKNTYVVTMSADCKVYDTRGGQRMYCTVKKYAN